MRAAMSRRAPIVLAALAACLLLAACGGKNRNSVHDANATVTHGAKLFADHCGGCHTLDAVGTEGGATKIKDRERVDGPNFNQRKECVQNVLYAIRNGGYSGAIMPENIVVGQDAQAVAEFLAKYSGSEAKRTAGGTPVKCTDHP
jgi:mono/diheme cytochrome c family protein